MDTLFTSETFRPYFFGNFTCIMIDVTSNTGEFWMEDHGPDFWRSVVLGAFYVICHILVVALLLNVDQTQLSWSLLSCLQCRVPLAFLALAE